MWLMIILEVTENPGLTLSLEGTFFENHRGAEGGREVKLTQPPPAVLGLKDKDFNIITMQDHLRTLCIEKWRP